MIDVAFRQLVLASAGVGMVAAGAIVVRVLARGDIVLRYRLMRALLVVAMLMVPLQLVAPRMPAGWGKGETAMAARAASPVRWVLWLGGGMGAGEANAGAESEHASSMTQDAGAAARISMATIVAGLGRWGPTLVVAVYGGGILLLIGVLVARLARTRRLLAVCRAVDDPAVLAIWSEARAKTGTRARTRLLECDGLPAPACFGWVRETVLIPVERSIQADSLRCAMVHELIHLRRRDPAWVQAQRVLKCVFWFHPLVWVFDRLLSADRELSCDALVVRTLGKPRTYANALLDYGGRRGAEPAMAATALAGFGSVVNLKRRIEMIPRALETAGRRRMWTIVLGVAAAAAAAFATHAALAAAVARQAEEAAPAGKTKETPVEFRLVHSATAGMQKAEVDAPAEPTRTDRMIQMMGVMRGMGRLENFPVDYHRISGSLTEQETVVSLRRALNLSEHAAAADGSKAATLQAHELILNLPEGSALKAVFEGAQVEIKQEGKASDIVVRQGTVRIVDEQGTTRIVLKPVDAAGALRLTATIENDEVSFKAEAADASGQAGVLQADIDLKPVEKPQANSANSLETRWELLKPSKLDEGPVRLKMQWVHDVAKLAEEAKAKEQAAETPK